VIEHIYQCAFVGLSHKYKGCLVDLSVSGREHGCSKNCIPEFCRSSVFITQMELLTEGTGLGLRAEVTTCIHSHSKNTFSKAKVKIGCIFQLTKLAAHCTDSLSVLISSVGNTWQFSPLLCTDFNTLSTFLL
jgi:hypothetical protein